MVVMKFRGTNLDLYSVDYFPMETSLDHVSLVYRQVDGGRFTFTAPKQNKRACALIHQAFCGTIMSTSQTRHLDLDAISAVMVKLSNEEKASNVPENHRLVMRESFAPYSLQRVPENYRIMVYFKLTDNNERLAVVEGPLHMHSITKQVNGCYQLTLTLANTQRIFSGDTPKIIVTFKSGVENFTFGVNAGILIRSLESFITESQRVGYIDLNVILEKAINIVPKNYIQGYVIEDIAPSQKLKP